MSKSEQLLHIIEDWRRYKHMGKSSYLPGDQELVKINKIRTKRSDRVPGISIQVLTNKEEFEGIFDFEIVDEIVKELVQLKKQGEIQAGDITHLGLDKH